MLRAGAISCSILLFPLYLFPQKIIYSRLSVDDGLASNFVRCSYQSPDGYLWIGTENGLQRYDGNSFVSANRKRQADNVPDLPVLQILETQDKKIWLHVGSYFGRFDPLSFRFKIAGLPLDGKYTDLSAAKIVAGSEGNVFLLLPGYGVLRFFPENNRFQDSFSRLPGLMEFKVSGLSYLPSRNYLVLSGKRGIGIIDLRANKFYTQFFNPLGIPILSQAAGLKDIQSVEASSDGSVWLISAENAGKLTAYLYSTGSKALQTFNILRDPTSYEFSYIGCAKALNRTWLYGAGLLNYTVQGGGRLTRSGNSVLEQYGIKFNTVRHIHHGYDRNAWIATDNGLYKASSVDNSIQRIILPEQNKHPISQVLSHSDGSIRVLTRGQGIFKQSYLSMNGVVKFSSGRLDYLSTSKHLEKDFNIVYGGILSRDKTVEWYGCRGGKLIRYHRSSGKSSYICPEIFGGENILHLQEDNKGKIWFGTEKGSLIYYDGTAFRRFGRIGSGINKLFLDNSGKIWIATEHNGVSLIDPEAKVLLKHYKSSSGGRLSADNPVNDIIQVSEKLVVFACSGSLNLVNPETHCNKIITGSGGLPSYLIYTLLMDNNGKLWLGTNGGLFRYDLKNNIFYAREGLVKTNNQWNVLTSSAKLANGELLFTGPNSILIFDPGKIADQSKPNPVSITDFKLFNDYLSVDSILREKGVRLAHDENSISISFSSFNFDRDDKFRYYYRLEGADTTWIKADKYLTASFSSLAPGKYVFVVKSQNPDGQSSANFMRLPIIIKPAYWQTWWFKVLMILVILQPVYIIYKLRIRRLLELQRLRENVARDLHDDVGSTLTSINILSEMAAMQTKRSPVVAEEYMLKISKNSSDMMQAMDDIVWSIKPANDSLAKVVARMREYMSAVLESKGIDCRFKIADQIEKSKLSMEQRKSVFLVYKEAVNNIAKYANASEVDVKINVDAGVLTMVIADNGIGISSLRSRNGNGLDNMQQRIEQLKGTFHISSLEGKGTTISFSININ